MGIDPAPPTRARIGAYTDPVPIVLLLLAAGPDLLVLAPKDLQPALAEWRAHREAQGHAVEVRAPGDDPAATVKDAHAASGGALRFVLLLGDAEQVPCAYRAGEAIKVWEFDPRIANDHALSDLDGDLLPDLAVGRLPAETADEAKTLLDKVLAYERSRDFGPWRRRVNVVAGLGGFGAAADLALETAGRSLLTQKLPERFSLSVTWANPNSPFCPPYAALEETVVRRFNEGALVVTYLGHGHAHGLDSLEVDGRSYPIFERPAVKRLRSEHGAPIAFLVACSTGRFDGDLDCLAEAMLLEPGGPVAAIASSRVSMPYANAILAKEMLDVLFAGRPATVGEWLRDAKRRLVNPAPGDKLREAIEMAATLIYPVPPDRRALEREEHLFLYNLLGDPAMRLPLPAPIRLRATSAARAGGRLKVVGECEIEDGEALVELAQPRDSARPNGYEAANRFEVAEARVKTAAGRFEAELVVPKRLPPGTYVVRAFVEGVAGAAAGSRKVTVREAGE